jgi:hypothetical protein
MHNEHALQVAITAYLNLLPCFIQGKAAFYNSEKGSMKFTPAQAGRNKQLQPCNEYKQPDLVIFKAGSTKCLFLELKAVTPYLKDGVTLKKSEHIAAQARSLEFLQRCGHEAAFCWSFEDAVILIDNFLKN